MIDQISHLDIEVRESRTSANNKIWNIGGIAECRIIFYDEDIYVYSLTSNTRGYGARLFGKVLEYLRTSHRGIPIVLYDNSRINNCNHNTQL